MSLWLWTLGKRQKGIPRRALFTSGCFMAEVADFFDFSTARGLVRGCAAVYIGRHTPGRFAMIVAATKPLFAWDCLEDSPTLKSIRDILHSLPDGKLLAGLQSHRGRGRNDYPLHVLWGVVVLQVVLRHSSCEAMLGELRRNAALRQLIGAEREEDVPKGYNVSRFLDVLGREPHGSELRRIFDALVRKLGIVVCDLGAATAGDATALNARRKADPRADGDLPQPSGGRKEYSDDEGHVSKVVEWFGFKLHLLVDVKHEVALAYEITATKAGDGETLPLVLQQAQANLPEGRIETLAYDKAADTNAVHELLDEAKIKPLIQMRGLWKDQTEQMLPGHDGRSNVVYDEAGTLYCYDRTSTPIVRHRMAYIGYEPQRQTIKYRCPARHEDWKCPHDAVCNTGKCYGKTVRVDQTIDLRRFPPIPRATKKFERMYKGRTAVERVNARLKIFWGADDGNLVGARRFHAMVGVVMIVHAAFATQLAAAPRREGTLGKLRLGPIQQTLREKPAA
jgi:hypothetical protein